jgi:hypothetical protein
MNIPIIASSFAGIADALSSMGFDLMQAIVWNRMPVKIDGVWHAEVRHG